MSNNFVPKSTGASDLLISEAGREIIPEGQIVRGFTFLTSDECHISINNGKYFYIRANQGYDMPPDEKVYSFKIQEAGVEYNWGGSVRRRAEDAV